MRLDRTTDRIDAEAAQRITPAEYERFQDYFYRDTGIVFGDAKRYFVDRRLTERMISCGVTSVAAYLRFLRLSDSSGTERQALINALTVNETYFYREVYQLRCLVSSILPARVQNSAGSSRDRIRIWSLPCSTGEEPYSIALFLLDQWADVDRHDVEIVGSDIDTNVLAQAAAGTYGDRSIQFLPDSVLSRYFRRVGEGRWQVIDPLRRSVDFRQANISDRAEMQQYRSAFDVIFCRNLLIYFDDTSRRWAAEALYDSLRPGGFLCLGHSESMSRISSSFILRKYRDAIVYQKPDR